VDEPIDGRRLRYQHRRPELLEAVGEYVLDNGVGSLSLRRIADAVGISHVTLQHHFGSKDELVAEIVEHLLERTFTPSGDYSDVDSDEPLRVLWAHWTSEAGQRDIRLFFEVLGQSLFDGSDYAGAVRSSIEHRNDLVDTNLKRLGCPDERARAHATVLLAVVRGLMMDLVATGDRERLDAAFEIVIEGSVRNIEEWALEAAQQSA
jgi:AcrR family transcriptional regulator